jgi:hypothetical protein
MLALGRLAAGERKLAGEWRRRLLLKILPITKSGWELERKDVTMVYSKKTTIIIYRQLRILRIGTMQLFSASGYVPTHAARKRLSP